MLIGLFVYLHIMKNILTISEAIKLAKKFKKEGKTLVLGGGCFDILHPGHIAYLQAAKKKGDILFILLENDKSISKNKGQNRPIHLQKERAYILSSIKFVDYIVLLPFFTKDAQYDFIVDGILPNIIAVTENDPNLHHKKRQAEKICGIIDVVTNYIPNKSTSILAKKLLNEL